MSNKHVEQAQETPIAYFRDIYNIRPWHYDCVLGQIKLPWNRQVVDIFINYNVKNCYRPVIDGLYAEEGSGIYLCGDSFSEQDLTEYIERIQKYKQYTEQIQNEKRHVLLEVYNLIQEKTHPSLLPFIKVLDGWILIYFGEYALEYDPETKIFSINKYYVKEPIERRYWWWNKDKDFTAIESASKEEISSRFVTIVKHDMRELADNYRKLLTRERP